MSVPIDTEWPYQRNLNIREIEKTPVSLVKTPLQIVSTPGLSPFIKDFS
jgi:hypothetical protein